jgi:hypothetical protein
VQVPVSYEKRYTIVNIVDNERQVIIGKIQSSITAQTVIEQYVVELSRVHFRQGFIDGIIQSFRKLVKALVEKGNIDRVRGSGSAEPELSAHHVAGNYLEPHSLSFPIRFFFYSSEIHSTGQTSAQAPQLVQVSGSMNRTSPFSLIASTGHSGSQAPQFVHSLASILYAIYFPPAV